LIVVIVAAQNHFCCNAVMPSRCSPGSALHLPIPRIRAGTATMRRAKIADFRLWRFASIGAVQRQVRS
jgi:hypothetical protein